MERVPTLRYAAGPRQVADEAAALAVAGPGALWARSGRAGRIPRPEAALRARGYVRDRTGGFREADGTRLHIRPVGPGPAEFTETVKHWL
ncbi:hypothetical protein [Streptomyces sp. Isolate_219]|uniref:hypothetical protein n=1 Tax=Streptomyces sp. Isolate_219 TaxID=2950110 RepID=UPI0021CA0274|nr:hypothetical protein [Streptomyces sp. Isolate_219]MCR8578768.1 hypothetical protein [Streptomyces sp. Isolate_219]